MQLIDLGKVHRMESLNAYVACCCAGHAEDSLFAICADCGAIDEWVDKGVMQDLRMLAEWADFTASRHVIEMRGRCAAC